MVSVAYYIRQYTGHRVLLHTMICLLSSVLTRRLGEEFSHAAMTMIYIHSLTQLIYHHAMKEHLLISNVC